MDMKQRGLEREASDQRAAAPLVPPVDIIEDPAKPLVNPVGRTHEHGRAFHSTQDGHHGSLLLT